MTEFISPWGKWLYILSVICFWCVLNTSWKCLFHVCNRLPYISYQPVMAGVFFLRWIGVKREDREGINKPMTKGHHWSTAEQTMKASAATEQLRFFRHSFVPTTMCQLWGNKSRAPAMSEWKILDYILDFLSWNSNVSFLYVQYATSRDTEKRSSSLHGTSY